MRRAAGILATAFPSVLLAAAPGLAAPWGSAEQYPLSVRVVVAPRPGGSIFTLARSARDAWPPDPYGSADVAEQARSAYEATARRLFRDVVSGDADAELEISVAAVDVSQRGATGSHASVEHAIVLRSSAGRELGRWRIAGDAEFVAASDTAMASALARAAATAARRLEAEFEQPPGVGDWLATRGIAARRAPVSRTLVGSYPLAARVVVVPGPAGSVFTRAPGAPGGWPPEPHGTANLEDQARAAWTAKGKTMFRELVDSGADVELEISVTAADVGHRSTGSVASVEHAAVLRTADRRELGRWSVRGEVEFVATSDQAMTIALGRAADDAAREVEAEFEDPPAIAGWLRQQGIPPRERTSVPRRFERYTPSRVFFVDTGAGIVTYEPTVGGAGDTVGYSLKAGVSNGFLLGDLFVSRWSPRSGFAELQLTSVGGDAGAAHRFGGFEVRSGVGVERIAGEASSAGTFGGVQRQDVSGTGVSLFAGVLYSACGQARTVCLRIGAELRRHVLSDLDVVGGRIQAAQNTVSLTAGFELPWGDRAAR